MWRSAFSWPALPGLLASLLRDRHRAEHRRGGRRGRRRRGGGARAGRAGGGGAGRRARAPEARIAVHAEAHRRGARLVRAHCRAGISGVEVGQTQRLAVAEARRGEPVVAARLALPAVAARVRRGTDDAVHFRAADVDRAAAQVVVGVVAAAARAVHGVRTRGPDVQDVVARHAVGQRLAGVAGDAAAHAETFADARLGRLQQRVVQEVAPAAAEAARLAGLVGVVAVVGIQGNLRQRAAAVVDVVDHVQRSAVHDRARHAGVGVVRIVAEHPHVLAAAFRLDGVIPGFRDLVAVDVGVVVREAGGGEVVLAADAVVVVVLHAARAVDLVVADHVVAAAVAEGDALRSERVGVAVPAVGAVAWVVDLVALDDAAVEGGRAHAADPGLAVHAALPAFGGGGAAGAAPAADVVVLDDDVVRARQDADAVDLRVLQRQAADDDVWRGDEDVVLLIVGDVDGRAARRRLVQHVAVRRAAAADGELAGARCRQGDGLRDRELLVPGRDRQPLLERLAGQAHLHFVLRARLQHGDRAAALRVARVEPHGHGVAPGAVALLTELH